MSQGPPVFVAPESWRRIQECAERRRDAARRLGIAVHEREEKFRQVLADCPAGRPDRFHIGQIFYEYTKAERFFLDLIDRAVAEQRAVGTAAILAAGVDVESGDFTIAEGGAVLQLLPQGYAPVTRAPAHLH